MMQKFQGLCASVGQRNHETKTTLVPVWAERCLQCWRLSPGEAPLQHTPLTRSVLIWRSTFLFCESLHSTCRTHSNIQHSHCPGTLLGISHRSLTTYYVLGTMLWMLHTLFSINSQNLLVYVLYSLLRYNLHSVKCQISSTEFDALWQTHTSV